MNSNFRNELMSVEREPHSPLGIDTYVPPELYESSDSKDSFASWSGSDYEWADGDVLPDASVSSGDEDCLDEGYGQRRNPGHTQADDEFAYLSESSDSRPSFASWTGSDDELGDDRSSHHGQGYAPGCDPASGDVSSVGTEEGSLVEADPDEVWPLPARTYQYFEGDMRHFAALLESDAAVDAELAALTTLREQLAAEAACRTQLWSQRCMRVAAARASATRVTMWTPKRTPAGAASRLQRLTISSTCRTTPCATICDRTYVVYTTPLLCRADSVFAVAPAARSRRADPPGQPSHGRNPAQGARPAPKKPKITVAAAGSGTLPFVTVTPPRRQPARIGITDDSPIGYTRDTRPAHAPAVPRLFVPAGEPGIPNIRNSCFINACLAVLLRIPQFRGALRAGIGAESPQANGAQSGLLHSLAPLVRAFDMFDGDTAASPPSVSAEVFVEVRAFTSEPVHCQPCASCMLILTCRKYGAGNKLPKQAR